MPQFRYQALNADNQPVAGEVLADSVAQAISQLEAAGLMVQSIGYASGQRPPAPRIQPATANFPVLTAAEQASLDTRLTQIVERGRALAPALQAYAAEMPSSRSRRRLLAFLRILQTGDTVQAVATLERQPAEWIPLLNATTGTNDHCRLLQAIIREYQPPSEFNQPGRGWIVYPFVVSAFATAVFLFIGIFVIPVFRDLFIGFGLPLQWPTQLVLAFYASITNGLFFIIAITIGIALVVVDRIFAAAGQRSVGNRSGRPFSRSMAIAQFSRYLADLLDADFQASTALRLASFAVDRRRLKQSAWRVAAAIDSQNDTSNPHDQRTLTSTVLYALQADLPPKARSAVLRDLGYSYEDRSTAAFSWTRGALEPISIVVIGGLVALTVIGLYLPLISLLKALT